MIQETKQPDCDCIKTVAENIKTKILAEEQEKKKGYEWLQGKWEYKSSFPKVRLYSNFIITSSFEKANGARSNPKNDHVSIYYSYCPFCGKKYPE